nr:MAG TPA: hypothetical protein [Caudoviricetes sp.]
MSHLLFLGWVKFISFVCLLLFVCCFIEKGGDVYSVLMFLVVLKLSPCGLQGDF